MSNRYTGYLLYGFAVDNDARPDYWTCGIAYPYQDGCGLVAIGYYEEAELLCAIQISVCGKKTVPISFADLQQQQPDAHARLKQYCELHGIEFKEPSWHLATSLS